MFLEAKNTKYCQHAPRSEDKVRKESPLLLEGAESCPPLHLRPDTVQQYISAVSRQPGCGTLLHSARK